MPFDCESQAQYNPIICDDEFEYQRVTALGIHKIIDPQLDLTDPAVWELFVDTDPPTNNFIDYINLVPDVEGEYDGGEATTAPGYGENLEIVESMRHGIVIRGEYNKKNEAFFNRIFRSKNNGITFFTGTDRQMQVVDQQRISIIPQLGVTNALETHRKFQLTISWSKLVFPTHVDVSDAVKALFF